MLNGYVYCENCDRATVFGIPPSDDERARTDEFMSEHAHEGEAS